MNALKIVALSLSLAFAFPSFAREGVEVGSSSGIRKLVPAEQLERSAQQQYGQLLQSASQQRALAPDSFPQLQNLRAIAGKLVPHALSWNDRAKNWRWEVNLIGSKQINAFCMPGGKIAFYTGILDVLQLSDDEIAMIMGHEMAHALREHARERMAKSMGTDLLLRGGAAVLGLGQLGDLAAAGGASLLKLSFSRSDETESDLVGMEIAARAGYDPRAAVAVWEKMSQLGKGGQPQWLSTHPSGKSRIDELNKNMAKVMPLYAKAIGKPESQIAAYKSVPSATARAPSTASSTMAAPSRAPQPALQPRPAASPAGDGMVRPQ
jgi:predicted Zn-dependent protease